MTMAASSTASTEPDAQASWLPMIIIAMGQILVSFNVSALPVSIGGIVDSFDVSPTSVATAIVTYSLFVASFIMLGARIGALLGSRRVFQAAVAVFGVAMAIMALSRSATMIVVAQGMAGAVAAALLPTIVVLIATNYKGKQQAQALGWLGASQAMAGVLAFLIAGFLGTWLGWRYAFGLLIIHAACILILSYRLKPVESRPGVKFDGLGVILVALAVILVSVGFNSINAWGLLLANPAAPLSLFGLSPAPVMIVFGIVFGQAFFVWSHKRQAGGKTPLIALEVLDTPQERSAVFSMFVIALLGTSINFLIPLYIQIVQGRSSLETAVAVIPQSLAVFTAAILVGRLYDRLTPRQIARCAFLVVAAGLTLLAIVCRNDWSTVMVVVGLIVLGLGQGALVTLLFNVLVTASPSELAGDVASLRGTTSYLAGAMGTATTGALAIGILSASITSNLVDNPAIPIELKAQVSLDNVTFVSNDRLLDVLRRTTATPDQVAEAVRINTEARLRALKIPLFLLAGLALLAMFPTGGLPDYVRGEMPGGSAQGIAGRGDRKAAAAT